MDGLLKIFYRETIHHARLLGAQPASLPLRSYLAPMSSGQLAQSSLAQLNSAQPRLALFSQKQPSLTQPNPVQPSSSPLPPPSFPLPCLPVTLHKLRAIPVALVMLIGLAMAYAYPPSRVWALIRAKQLCRVHIHPAALGSHGLVQTLGGRASDVASHRGSPRHRCCF